MPARTDDIVRALLAIVSDTPCSSASRGSGRDDVCAAAHTLLDDLANETALRTLRVACHEAALAKDKAVLARAPADAALLDAAVNLGSAVELLAESADDEARDYAGATLGVLGEQRVLAGGAANHDDATAALRAELKARLAIMPPSS